MLGWAAQLLSDPRTWMVAAVLAAAALAGGMPLARWTGWPAWPTTGMLLGVAAIATLTLSPALGQPVGGPAAAEIGACVQTLADPPAWLQALVSRSDRGERVGNVLMFVPACFFAVLATRRPALVAALGAAAPVLVELGQAALAAGRDCAADDWVNNATGAVLGTVAGAAVLALARLVRPGAPDDRVQGTQQDHQVERE